MAELGATANTVDPVFQVMPRSVAAGPFSITNEPVFPIPVVDEELRTDDVLWIDTGINLHGYASDFGSTWIVGHEPDDRRARPVRDVARGRRPRAWRG